MAEHRRAGASRSPRPDREPDKVSRLVPVLLRWFRANARELPWRRSTDPYGIWVSEVMLQQTQVSTVIPFWERWMRNLPSIRGLATADQQTLHKLWEGLGYYRRVRNLQKAAQAIMAQHRGQFPESYEAVLALPGIGPYTAGAICSIAFNQPKPILDGNVIRVLTRLFGIHENPRKKPANTKLWAIAGQLVQQAAATAGKAGTRNCANLNQSLMEIGALVCTARLPRCSKCPLRCACVAFRRGWVHRLPNSERRVRVTPRHFVAVVARHANRFLVRQRPPGVVNAQLWEFPNLELEPSPDAGAPMASAKALLHGGQAALKRLCTIKHSITRYRITLEVFGVAVRSPSRVANGTGRWLTTDELQQLPFASAHRKILAYLASGSFRNRSMVSSR